MSVRAPTPTPYLGPSAQMVTAQQASLHITLTSYISRRLQVRSSFRPLTPCSPLIRPILTTHKQSTSSRERLQTGRDPAPPTRPCPVFSLTTPLVHLRR